MALLIFSLFCFVLYCYCEDNTIQCHAKICRGIGQPSVLSRYLHMELTTPENTITYNNDSQEKLQTMLMQNFGVTNKEYYGMLWYFLEWLILAKG